MDLFSQCLTHTHDICDHDLSIRTRFRLIDINLDPFDIPETVGLVQL